MVLDNLILQFFWSLERLIDLKKQTTELGIAIYKDDKLAGVDTCMEDAAAFGFDEDSMQRLRQYIERERVRS